MEYPRTGALAKRSGERKRRPSANPSHSYENVPHIAGVPTPSVVMTVSGLVSQSGMRRTCPDALK